MLPSRDKLDQDIFHGHKTQLLNKYKSFILTIQNIYNIIQSYYDEHNYLNLP